MKKKSSQEDNLKEEIFVTDVTGLLNKQYSLLDVREDEIIEVTFVREGEEEIENNKISLTTPLAKALIGKTISDIVVIKSNIKNRIMEEKFKIMSIE